MATDPASSANRLASIEAKRPHNLHSSKSFSRFEPRRPDTPSRNRASTLQNGVVNELSSPDEQQFSHGNLEEIPPQEDVFEKRLSEESSREPRAARLPSKATIDSLPDGFDELPIELISLTDRYVYVTSS